MGGVEAVLTYGISGWPTWVPHRGREMQWHVLEIIEPDVANASPARTDSRCRPGRPNDTTRALTGLPYLPPGTCTGASPRQARQG
jgi:hypothetical protein